MKKLITLFTLFVFTFASADQSQAPSILDADTTPTKAPMEQPTSLPERKEPKNRTSLYVFIGTVVTATVGLLASTTHTGRAATQEEKDSKTGNVLFH